MFGKHVITDNILDIWCTKLSTSFSSGRRIYKTKQTTKYTTTRVRNKPPFYSSSLKGYSSGTASVRTTRISFSSSPCTMSFTNLASTLIPIYENNDTEKEHQRHGFIRESMSRIRHHRKSCFASIFDGSLLTCSNAPLMTPQRILLYLRPDNDDGNST